MTLKIELKKKVLFDNEISEYNNVKLNMVILFYYSLNDLNAKCHWISG